MDESRHTRASGLRASASHATARAGAVSAKVAA